MKIMSDNFIQLIAFKKSCNCCVIHVLKYKAFNVDLAMTL